MTVAIWCGEGKPNELNEYLSLFVQELNHLLLNGAMINGRYITIRFRCILCDTPARAFIKGIQNSRLRDAHSPSFFLPFRLIQIRS